MGEGDILNSTTDVPPTSSTDRFSNFNPDRSKGVPNSIDTRLRDDYSRLKTAVYQWGEIVCSSTLTVDVIEREHNALCVQIEQKFLEVLLKKGDYNLVGELGSLKDRLSAIKKEAKQLARARD